MDQRTFSPVESGRHSVWDTVIAIAVIVFFLLPIALMWLPGASDSDRAASLPAIAWKTLGSSLAVAGGSAVLAVIVGGLIGALLTLTNLPGRGLWATIMLCPFISPPTVWAMGQVYCYGGGGLLDRWLVDSWPALRGRLNAGHYTSTALVLAQIHAPLAMILIGRGLARLNWAGFEAARLYLRPLAIIRWIVAAVWPELAAAFLLAFALGLGNFAVPHVLQCLLYPLEIYTRMTNYLDQTGAVWVASPLVVLVIVATVFISMSERRAKYSAVDSDRSLPPVRLGKWDWAAATVVFLYLAATICLPLGALIYECRSAGRFVDAVRAAVPETQNTLAIALCASGLACIAGLAVGIWNARRASWLADALAIVPIGLPALVVGLAYLRFYNRPWPVDLSAVADTIALVVLGLSVRGWPFANRLIRSGYRRIAPDWIDAARLAGLGPMRRLFWITGPLLWEHVAAAAVVAFILAAGEVELSQMLCAPGGGTLALRLFTFLHFGPTHVAASLAVLELAVAIVPVMFYFLLTNRRLQLV